MPRSRGSGGGARPSAPSRPAARPAAPTPQQARQSSTAAHPQQPPHSQAPPQQTSGGSGLFGQMASTAAGVAVGSSIGHAVGSFFSGGSAQPYEQQQQQPQQVAAQGQQYGSGACDMDARNFTNCMNENNGNMQICGWYLEQLKACQQASSQY